MSLLRVNFFRKLETQESSRARIMYSNVAATLTAMAYDNTTTESVCRYSNLHSMRHIPPCLPLQTLQCKVHYELRDHHVTDS